MQGSSKFYFNFGWMAETDGGESPDAVFMRGVCVGGLRRAAEGGLS